MQPTPMTVTQADLFTIIDNLTTAVLVVNTEFEIILANNELQRIVGRPKHELAGKRPGEVLGCENARISLKGCGFSPACLQCNVRHLIQETLQSKEGRVLFDIEIELETLGPRILNLGAQYLPLGATEAVLLSVEDVTEAREKDRLKLENVRLVAAVETAAAVCHQLNQPLMVMCGYVELLLDSRSETDEEYFMLKELYDSVRRIEAISRKLMGLSTYKTTPYAGKSRMLDLNQSSTTAAAA